MQKEEVKVGKLRFMLHLPEDQELLPSLEIENQDKIILETLNLEKALQLKKLLEDFLTMARDS